MDLWRLYVITFITNLYNTRGSYPASLGFPIMHIVNAISHAPGQSIIAIT